ncbi:gliding motility-associated lipoprotein GldH [Dysgonomonas sp. PFB1-18]|uniref:gliding motility lipoprotein GldH n=1 Tax=unclassified Dysgonomonas TaxID=2630389 RepID=UPI00247501B6|nr:MULTISPECIES: gliding motility lipoprotein GldH [unclassified Dysgonomonas]MDH6309871.1 gliding motility-associated lipoprotein GldH [Dysgonomonas sp. PF1-14]MDH6339415.1 gliding motility-associated lipoprotein GldH [Dysgonomonas sp. PF1-16]MDH6380914.1 gliding motility-associated lipoprotein GldH [Dysgonomonas sp. PFB1-18]MDH6397923.1 gliding motility-associated lipoprotein GldH [Dysgonomonas sp. PF1-23]
MESPIRKNLRHKVVFVLLFALLTMVNISCEKQEIYYRFHELKDARWTQTDTMVFDVDSTLFDLYTPYRLSVEVTNNTNYPYKNIWFFVHDNQSNDTIFEKSSIEFQLADEFGKWNGSGFGTLFQVSFPLNENLIFTQKRNYCIKIGHGMRDESLTGIEKIGLKIEKVIP